MTREEATAFYRKHYRRVFNICIRILGDSADAEEAMQDTILRYISAGPEGLSTQQEEAWLARAAVRRSLDTLRARKRSRLFMEELSEQLKSDEKEDLASWQRSDETEDLASWQRSEKAEELASWQKNEKAEEYTGGIEKDLTPQRIVEAISAVGEPYSVILSLVLIEGLDYEEIAAYTGQKQTTLRSIYSRGLNKLRNRLLSHKTVVRQE